MIIISNEKTLKAIFVTILLLGAVESISGMEFRERMSTAQARIEFEIPEDKELTEKRPYDKFAEQVGHVCVKTGPSDNDWTLDLLAYKLVVGRGLKLRQKRDRLKRTVRIVETECAKLGDIVDCVVERCHTEKSPVVTKHDGTHNFTDITRYLEVVHNSQDEIVVEDFVGVKLSGLDAIVQELHYARVTQTEQKAYIVRLEAIRQQDENSEKPTDAGSSEQSSKQQLASRDKTISTLRSQLTEAQKSNLQYQKLVGSWYSNRYALGLYGLTVGMGVMYAYNTGLLSQCCTTLRPLLHSLFRM